MDFQEKNLVKSDTFSIDNDKDTLIIGSEGTTIFFEKGSFVQLDGTMPSGKIKIALKECLKFSDMIRENLTTSSNGQPLETRGMINISAFSDDKELQIKNGKKYIIHFPKDSTDIKKQMCLFYGKRDSSQINWELDKETLLRPTAFLSTYGHTGWPFNDTTKIGLFFKGKRDKSIEDFFYEKFDNAKLKDTSKFLGKYFGVDFIVTKQGKIINIKVEEEIYDKAFNKIPSKTIPDPYFYEFIKSLPELEPYYTYGNEIIDSKCFILISTGLFPPDYRKNESYNRLFNQKYSVFKNKKIQTMNDAELNYFVFSATKLGWINCDFFWKNDADKIDYLVKIDPTSKPNVKLIFTASKSIMGGHIEGENYVFNNVPIDASVKIVSIKFDKNKPLLSIAHSKTSKAQYKSLTYKEFAITDLENELNN